MSANKEYYMLYVISNAGTKIPCMLSRDDITKGIDRAGRNLEDIEKLSTALKLYHKILNWF